MSPLVSPSPATAEIVAVATQVAKNLGAGCVGSGHLALALLEAAPENEALAYLLAKNGVKVSEAALYARSQLETDERGDKNAPLFSPSARKVLEVAALEAEAAGQRAIAPEAVLIGLLAPQKNAHVGQVLRPLGLEFRHMRRDWRALLKSQNPYGFDHPLGRLDVAGAEIIKLAQKIARESGCGRINSGHLLLALCQHSEGQFWLRHAAIEIADLQKKTRAALISDGETIEARAKFDNSARAALERALECAMSANKIGPRLLLLGLLAPDGNANIAPDDVAARLMEPHADEVRIAAFDSQKRAAKAPSPDDWPLSKPLLFALTLAHFCWGRLILGALPTGDLSPILLLFFVPAMGTALASRLFGASKLHFNMLLSLICAVISLWLTLAIPTR